MLQSIFLGLYGSLFFDDQEAAFSNKSLWKSIGNVVVFAYGAFISVSMKIYILIGCLVLGIILYLICELLERRNSTNKSQKIENSELCNHCTEM